MVTRPAPTPELPATAAAPAISGLDGFMRRLLWIRPGPPSASEDQANRLFSTSIAISAARCLATYILIPIVFPLVGFASGNEPAVGIPLSLIAIYFDIRAVRRFWQADHAWRKPITVLYLLVVIMLLTLLIVDIAAI